MVAGRGPAQHGERRLRAGGAAASAAAPPWEDGEDELEEEGAVDGASTDNLLKLALVSILKK